METIEETQTEEDLTDFSTIYDKVEYIGKLGKGGLHRWRFHYTRELPDYSSGKITIYKDFDKEEKETIFYAEIWVALEGYEYTPKSLCWEQAVWEAREFVKQLDGVVDFY